MVLAVVNPKVLFICAAAGLAIGTAGIGTMHAWIALACFVAVSASTAAIPILATPSRATGWPSRWSD